MNAVVFCGPSVTPEDARAVLPEASFLGPASLGDVYRAARRRPRAIAICDGSVDHRFSVSHEEILWALSQDVRVYGASSLGALRAVELAPFGMIGVGAIYEQYRDGVLEGDDEIAVVHESEARGYRPLSEALVNVRATLARAAHDGVIARDTAERLSALGRAIFYPERSFEALFQLALTAGVAETEVERLRRFLHDHRVVNQKRLDAFALLSRVRDDLRENAPAALPPFEFQNTSAWHAFRSKIDREAAAPSAADRAASVAPAPSVPAPVSPRGLDVAPAVWAEALERSLALLLADSSGARPDADAVQRESDAFRNSRGLSSAERTEAWLAENDLDVHRLDALLYEEHLVRRFRDRARALAKAQLENTLRLRGEYTSEKTQP